MQALASSSALLRKRKPSKKTLMAYGPAKPMAECSGLSINETLQGRKMQFQPKSRMLGLEQSDTIRSRDSSVSGQGAPLQTYREKTTEDSPRRGSMEGGQSKDCGRVRAAQLLDMMDSSIVVMSNDPVKAAQPIELMNSSSVITSSGTHSPSPLSTPRHKYEESFFTNLDDGDKDAILKQCREACQSIIKHKPEKVKGQPMDVTGEFVTGIQILTHFAYEDINSESHEKYIEDLVCKTGALDALLDFVACSLKEWNLSEYDASSSPDYLDWVLGAVQFVCNLSDSNIEVKRGIASNQQAMPVLVKGFDDQAEAHIDGNLSSQQEQTLMLSLAVVHNAASLPENVAALRAHDLITVVRKYLDSPSTYNRMFSISILANLVNESEAAQLLGTHTGIFSFILKRLDAALDTDGHRSDGWSVEELARTVKQLARNDANKKVLVEKNCLPIFTKIIQRGNQCELQEALPCLWYLSFEQENKSKILAEPGLVAGIREKSRTVSGEAKRACLGILWTLGDQEFKQKAKDVLDATSIEYERTLSSNTKPATSETTNDENDTKAKGHVMISYQSSNKEIIKKICSDLRGHGIPVWLDVDNMDGSTLQAMAQAVEESFVVVIAMCQRYKDSPNTRAEAEYAFQQRKPIIPLKLQPNYNPDGWLGIILGSKLFYDFSGKYTYESRIDGLVKAVFKVAGGQSEGLYVIGGAQTVVATTAVTVEAAPVQRPVTSSRFTPVARQIALRHQVPEADEWRVQAWTKEDVTRWLAKHKLEKSSLSDLTGEEILYMHRLRLEAPESFNNCLKQELQLSSLLNLARATKAFEDLTLE